MDNKCLECGALQRNGLDCRHMLGEIITWEYADPELLKKHFLTVASYNLQHPSQFTDEAIQGLKISLSNYLSGKEGISEIRQRNTLASEGSKRVRKPEPERVIVPRKWPVTIADVYLPDQPQGVADRVQAWAESINMTRMPSLQ
jgi:hypothetical protein